MPRKNYLVGKRCDYAAKDVKSCDMRSTCHRRGISAVMQTTLKRKRKAVQEKLSNYNVSESAGKNTSSKQNYKQCSRVSKAWVASPQNREQH